MYVMIGHCWKPYTGHSVGGELDFMALIGGTEEGVRWDRRILFFILTSTVRPTYCLATVTSFIV